MKRVYSLSSSYVSLVNRLHALILGFSKPATGFVRQPEPRSIGSYARGLQLKAGNILFAGHLIEAPNKNLWDITPPDFGFLHEAHGFGWLDDLASVGDQEARMIAQRWVETWIKRFGRGTGPGWQADITGRRLIRWIHHGFMILRGLGPESSKFFYQSLGRQTLFLSRRWQATPPGVPRFEALVGLIYAGLTLEGMEEHVKPATSALARECKTQIDDYGGIPTRNPEELLEILTLLIWVADALRVADWIPSSSHLDALDRIAPTLRMLRHTDGSLARYHGGSEGIEGRLDDALAQSGNKQVSKATRAMGFGRISAGLTSVIIDAEAPPEGPASLNAHASTLAIELTSGRNPVIVNAGSGARFGADWESAGRKTQSHSTLAIANASSARFGRLMMHTIRKNEGLIDGPDRVPFNFSYGKNTKKFEVGHNGYVKTTGLTHVRRLELSLDGNFLEGEDLLIALEDDDKKCFAKLLGFGNVIGIPYKVRFHLHPDVSIALDMGGVAASLTLKNGEIWVFRNISDAELSVEQSTFFDEGHLKPRNSNQIVLSYRTKVSASRTRWSLTKALPKAKFSQKNFDNPPQIM